MQQDESKRVFRNHPSVIVSYLLTAAIVMIVLVFLSLREYAWDNKFETIIIVALVMLARWVGPTSSGRGRSTCSRTARSM